MSADKKNIRVRFAPSPTGYLHIGGARTALFNWLFARKHNGVFVLRIEDTDIERLQEEALHSIYDGLRWLGLHWDEGPEVGGPYGPYRQSQRLEIYQEYAQRLLKEGYAYYCYCLPEELEAEKQKMLARGEPPRYNGRCRNLTETQRREFENEGRYPAIRFRMPETDIEVNDIIRGHTIFKAETQGDFIILRKDKRPTYHLANVVDDTLMHISHVIRGEDLYPGTPRQIALYRALGFEPPEFAHLPIILAPDRSKLSKRYGAVAVSWYREQGFIPEAIVNYLALLGWSPPDEQEIKSIEELIKDFSLERVAKAGAIFDIQKLRFINAVKLRTLPVEKVAEYAKPFFNQSELKLVAPEETFLQMIELVRDSVETAREFPDKCRIFLQLPEFSPEIVTVLRNDKTLKMLQEMAKCFREIEEFNLNAVSQCLKKIGKSLGLKGKELYHPLRLALTGAESGPELVGIINVLGKEGIIQRLDHCLRKILDTK